MTNPVLALRNIKDGDLEYQSVMFWCPGCEYMYDGVMVGGLHMLPINTEAKAPAWTFDGNLDAPTLWPSILTAHEHARRPGPTGELLEQPFVCHSFIKEGVFDFLSDCTHQHKGDKIPMVPLPDWVLRP